MIGKKGHLAGPQGLDKLAGNTGIFAQDQIGGTKALFETVRGIAEITDRRGGDVKARLKGTLHQRGFPTFGLGINKAVICALSGRFTVVASESGG
jgi:hypothetical protein